MIHDNTRVTSRLNFKTMCSQPRRILEKTKAQMKTIEFVSRFLQESLSHGSRVDMGVRKVKIQPGKPFERTNA